MYRHSSNQNSDRAQLIVSLDIVDRGYIPCIPQSRDSIYDLVVDKGNGKFETVQVKWIADGYKVELTTRGKGEHSKVSKGGKVRNNHFYRDFNIDWIVGVRNTNELFYYPLWLYKTYEYDIDVRKVAAADFGRYNVPSHRQATVITGQSLFD